MAKKQTRASKIRKYLKDNPTAKTADVAKMFETRYQNVYAIRRKMETPMVAKENWKTLGVFSSDTPMQIEMFEPKADPVNHPAHYKVGGIETIDFIEAKGLNYNLGNVVKYITRADLKGDRKENLEKALWYLKRELGV